MYRTPFLFVVLLFLGCKGNELPHGELIGKWKSNEKLTLESMNSVEGVTVRARKLFENDFFGNLVVEYRENEYRSTNAKDEYDSGFQPYEVLEVTDEYISIKEWNNFLKEQNESKIYFEGNCYYVITSKFNFREYFGSVQKSVSFH